MPIYEYRCTACHTLNEFFLKVSDPHPQICPACGVSESLQKQISQTSFALKGEGWYVTDYKQSGGPAKTNQTESETSEPAGESAKDSSAAEPKVSADKASPPASSNSSPEATGSAVASGSKTKPSSPD